MPNYQLPHHRLIMTALAQFDADFFTQHAICFGGGTRIALELDEYRESVVIDFLNRTSTRLLVLAVITIFLHKIPTNIPITIRHIIPYV